jgi:hypothetical protein
MANRNWSNGGKLYAMETKPVLVSCNFIVDSTNGNGLGIRSLKGPAVDSVYMHTSSTPAPGSPNPASGIIQVQLQDNYNRYLGGFSGQVSPLSGTPLTSVTAHTAYVIVSLGTTTLAQWQAVGLPLGVTPNVGVAFIATATGAIGGTGSVETSATAGSGIDHIEVLGDPNQTSYLSNSAINGGMIIILQCFFEGAITAPANGSVIGLSFYLSDSSIQIQGE